MIDSNQNVNKRQAEVSISSIKQTKHQVIYWTSASVFLVSRPALNIGSVLEISGSAITALSDMHRAPDIQDLTDERMR